jgi:hypothetical protein
LAVLQQALTNDIRTESRTDSIIPRRSIQSAGWKLNERLVKAASSAANRLHLERLPDYAPDLNPAEDTWR